MAQQDDKTKALDMALGQIEKQFGKGSIMKLDGTVRADVDSISTGSLGLDIALGIGGLPRGRVIEIYGPESSGKTTLALQTIAEAQKRGGICAFVDAEHALDPVYARKLGVKIDRGVVVADGPARALIDDRRIDEAFSVRFDRLKTPDGWLLRASTSQA